MKLFCHENHFKTIEVLTTRKPLYTAYKNCNTVVHQKCQLTTLSMNLACSALSSVMALKGNLKPGKSSFVKLVLESRELRLSLLSTMLIDVVLRKRGS